MQQLTTADDPSALAEKLSAKLNEVKMSKIAIVLMAAMALAGCEGEEARKRRHIAEWFKSEGISDPPACALKSRFLYVCTSDRRVWTCISDDDVTSCVAANAETHLEEILLAGGN